MGYFCVALAGVTHTDLLLSVPVRLPVLRTQIQLRGFFLFAPALLIFHLVFLAVQDQDLTRIHRSYVVVDVALLAALWLARGSAATGLRGLFHSGRRHSSGLLLLNRATWGSVLLFSFCIATLPTNP